MAGIERTDQLPPFRQNRQSDHEPARDENRKGGDLSGRFGTGGTPFRDGSGKSGRDQLQAREKVFAQALRANELRGTPEQKDFGTAPGETASAGRGTVAEAGKRGGRPDRGNGEEDAGGAVLLARAGPEAGVAAGRPPEAPGAAPSADLVQRLDALARRIGDQIDAQLRVNLIGTGDGGFRLRVAIDDPGMALKSITVQGEGDVLSINLHFAEDMLDRETLASLAGQLATTLAARFPRRTIEISGLPVGPDKESDRDEAAPGDGPVHLGALFARR